MSDACKYCESEHCDTDCYSCSRMIGYDRPTAAELRESGRRGAKLWLVILKDKDLYREPDIAIAFHDGTELGAGALGLEMEAVMRLQGRHRCVHRVREVTTGFKYRLTALVRTPRETDS